MPLRKTKPTLIVVMLESGERDEVSQKIYQRIIQLALESQRLARSVGIPYILQPGLVKEMIIANHLGHKLLWSKRDADACDFNDDRVKYEYLSCKQGGSGQFDRMFKSPQEKRERSLHRIMRNKKIYFAVFYSDDQLMVETIYEIEPDVMRQEAVRQLDVSGNDISHVGFREKWAKSNGKVVYKGGC